MREKSGRKKFRVLSMLTGEQVAIFESRELADEEAKERNKTKQEKEQEDYLRSREEEGLEIGYKGE